MKRWLVVVSLVAFAAPALADPDEPPLYKCHAATGKLRATFKPETELKELVAWIMGFSCKNIVLGVNVDLSTKVTLLAPNELTPKQALKLFADAVDAAGYTVVDRGDNLVIKAPPTAAKPCPTTAATPPATPPNPDAERDLYALMDTAIKKLDDTHVEISQKLIDAVLANPTAIERAARIVPSMTDGKQNGFRLYAIRLDSFFARIGLVNGDDVQTINGFALTSPDKALEVYTKVRKATKIELGLIRRDKPLTLTITVKP